MEMENYLSALKEELGDDMTFSEEMSGVYYVESIREERFTQEYYAVLDTAPIAARVRNYGKKIDGLRLFSWNEPASGWQIVHYEVSKYQITIQKTTLTEWQFRDLAFHAMELHPEYFGAFPVPFHTPRGYTLLHRTLSNGVYWLETSECKELLAVCFPICESELSFMAKAFGERMAHSGSPDAAGHLFFSKEASCIPICELMETRKSWDGTVIDHPALMNAIWTFVPEYAMHLNGWRPPELDTALARFLKENGIEAMPGPDGKDVTGFFPEAGTDFLLLMR